MKKNTMVAIWAVFAAALMLFASLDTAEARNGHGFSGGRSFGAARFHSFSGPRFRSFSGPIHRGFYPRHVRRGYVYGALPLAAYGGYRYVNGGGCYWLRRRAIETGSPYWWRRYRACRDGYGW